MASEEVVVSLKAKVRDLQSGLNRAENSLDDTAASADNTAESLQTLSRRGGDANQLLFSLGDAVQDAQFGLRGVGNNIAFTAEEFANLTRRAGGVTAAFRTIAGSLLGAGGIILAIQTLISFGPQIVSFFQGTEDAAEGANDELERTRGAFQQIIGELRDLPSERLSSIVGDLTTLRNQLRQAGFGGVGPLADQFSEEEAQQAAAAIDALIEATKVDPQVEQFFLTLTDLGIPAGTAQRLSEIAAGAREVEEAIRQVETPNLSGVDPAGPQTPGGIPEFTSQDLRGLEGLAQAAREARLELRLTQVQGTETFQALRGAAVTASGGFADLIADVATLDRDIRSLGDVFRRLGRIVQQAIQQIISDLIRATIQAAIFRAIAGAFSLPAGLLFPNGGASPSFTPGPTMASRTGPVSITSSVLPSGDIAFGARKGASNRARLGYT